MKLFQKLLLAPAALGLLAPVAASAADLASAGMNDYIQQSDLHNFRVWADQNQVTSVSQLSDVKPTDWAYQALSNLVEKYGCVAGYPNGTYKGGQAMTRYEAAALLNACLDRVTEITDELQRLQKEFGAELAVLKGRVDGLEAKVGELQATQFSTTTKLQGDTFWTIGANAFGGQNNNKINGIQANASVNGGTVFNYDLRLNLNTSFTGKDLLYTRLRSGNYTNSPFLGGGTGNTSYSLMALDRAFAPTGGNNVFNLDRLYYRFPVSKQFTAMVGPRARNTEFLAVAPFYYGDFSGLDFFTLHGAPGTYNKATGGLAGLMWKQNVKKGKPFFAVSTSYVAPSADNSNTGTTTTSYGGVFQNNSAGSWLTQLGYQAQQWKATFGWRYGQCGGPNNYTNRRGTQAAITAETCGAGGQWAASTNTNNNFALGLAWQPKKSGTLIPSISGGWGYTAYAYGNTAAPAVATSNTTVVNAGSIASPNIVSSALQPSNIAATQSWTVGLQWKDAFVKGNSAGMAVGQPSFVTKTRNGVTPFDGNYAWEWWYKFQVSDNISVTPMLFYLSNPSSAGANNTATTGIGANVFGGLLAGQIKF